MYRRLLIPIVLACCFVLGSSTARPPSAWADTPADAGPVTLVDAGAPVVTAPQLPSDALHNPATDPVAAWSDAKAARKVSWPLLVFAVLTMVGKGLAYGRDALKGMPLIGKVAEWLSVGKRAVVVAGLATVGAAGYDVLVSGGSWVSALLAAGLAAAGAMHSTTKGAAAAPA